MKSHLSLTLFLILLATSTLQLVAILRPNFITTTTPPSSPILLRSTYGLFKRCDLNSWSAKHNPTLNLNLDEDDGETTCRRFPVKSDCAPEGQELHRNAATLKDGEKEKKVWIPFCTRWLAARYLAIYSLLLSAILLITTFVFALPLSNSHRSKGAWKPVSALFISNAFALGLMVAIVADAQAREDRFWLGGRLGSSFVLSTVALSVNAFAAFGVAGLGLMGLAEDREGVLAI